MPQERLNGSKSVESFKPMEELTILLGEAGYQPVGNSTDSKGILVFRTNSFVKVKGVTVPRVYALSPLDEKGSIVMIGWPQVTREQVGESFDPVQLAIENCVGRTKWMSQRTDPKFTYLRRVHGKFRDSLNTQMQRVS